MESWREPLWRCHSVGSCLGSAGPTVPTSSSLQIDLPKPSLTIFRGCGVLVRTCGEVPLGRMCLEFVRLHCPQNLLPSEDLPRTSLTILRGCGELVRTCGEVPLGGVLSGVGWPQLSPQPPPFTKTYLEYL